MVILAVTGERESEKGCELEPMEYIEIACFLSKYASWTILYHDPRFLSGTSLAVIQAGQSLKKSELKDKEFIRFSFPVLGKIWCCCSWGNGVMNRYVKQRWKAKESYLWWISEALRRYFYWKKHTSNFHYSSPQLNRTSVSKEVVLKNAFMFLTPSIGI